MSDELRIGFTTNPAINYTGWTLSHLESWLYSDGSSAAGIWNSGKRLVSQTDCFRAGDSVFITLDFQQRQASFFLKDKLQGSVEIPPGMIYPLVALDAADDVVEISPVIKV